MLILLAVTGGGGVVFYVTHIEEVPVSGRRRFICFSEATVEEMAQMEYKKLINESRQDGSLLSEWDSRSRTVARVMARLVEGNNLQHVQWDVNVIDSEGMP